MGTSQRKSAETRQGQEKGKKEDIHIHTDHHTGVYDTPQANTKPDGEVAEKEQACEADRGGTMARESKNN